MSEIFKKIPEIMSEMDAIEKKKKNQQQNFMYRGIDDIYAELQKRLAKAQVFCSPEVLEQETTERVSKNGGALTFVRLKIKYTFYASDGSSFTAVVIGEGMDSGDKASNKAMSIAQKYAFIQVFCIPTQDAVDPDAESHEVKPKAQNTKPAVYKFPGGRFQGKTPNEIPKDDLVQYLNDLSASAKITEATKFMIGKIQEHLSTNPDF